MNYAPPTVPLSVTWEGTQAYTPPAVPMAASWSDEHRAPALRTSLIPADDRRYVPADDRIYKVARMG